jgi:PAS domain S-box-containing protein
MRPWPALESHLTAYLISLAISAAVAAWCWDRRHTAAGAGPYALVALSQAFWTLGYILEVFSSSLAGKLFWDNVQFITLLGWVVGFAAFTAQYTGRRVPRPASTYALVAFPFIALVVLAFTDQWHGLVRSRVRLVPSDLGPALLYDFEPVVWAISLYGYAAFLVCLGMLLAKYIGAARIFHLQHGLVLLGNAIPILGTVLTLTVLVDSPARDLAPVTFALANVLVAIALSRLGLFDLVPVARSVVVESTNAAVFVLDAEGRIIDVNPAGRRMVPGARGDAIGKPASEVFDAWPALRALIERGSREPTVVEMERADGTQFIAVRAFPLRRGALREGGHVIVAQDVTAQHRAKVELREHRDRLDDLVRARTAELQTANEELRRESDERQRVEAQLHQAQKMDAIGRLAGGIAHDFNNLLTVIIGHAELLLRTPAAHDPEDRADLEGIVHASRQAGLLTQQLLAFGRKQVLQPAVLDPNGVLRDMEPMLRRLLAENIELVIDTQPDIGHVMVDPSRLQQVVLNLVINARDAMPRGGRLRIETGETLLGDVAARRHAAASPGHFVTVRVTDTGVGMDREVQERIFEPFFTTKEKGRGTGLGLATVHGIVEQSGGKIAVESEPGRGSTFTVYLPRMDPPPEETPAVLPRLSHARAPRRSSWRKTTRWFGGTSSERSAGAGIRCSSLATPMKRSRSPIATTHPYTSL